MCSHVSLWKLPVCCLRVSVLLAVLCLHECNGKGSALLTPVGSGLQELRARSAHLEWRREGDDSKSYSSPVAISEREESTLLPLLWAVIVVRC